MSNCKLFVGIFICTGLAAMAVSGAKFAWNPYNATPAMGHAMTPSSQDVVYGQSTFTITAEVTDMDTFQDAVDLTLFAQMSGNENDVTIQREGDFSSFATNTSFDSSTGKRTQTYVFIPPSDLCQNAGEIRYATVRTRGVEQMAYLRQDASPTNWSASVIAYKYVPTANPGG